MNLENIKPIDMVLKIFPSGGGFSFVIDIFGFSTEEQIHSDEIFKTSEEAYELGNKIIMSFKKRFNLNEHTVH